MELLVEDHLAIAQGDVKARRPRRHQSEDHDIVWGAHAVAAVLNLDYRQAFYLLQHGKLPGRKIGGRWCCSRRALLAAVGVE
jgi:hypothetical protein